jgi:hypothetical protein
VRRFLLLASVGSVLVLGAGFFVAGRLPGPEIVIVQPLKAVGQNSTLEFTVSTPGGTFERIEAHLEQQGASFPVVDANNPGEATVRQESAETVRISRPLGRRSLPKLAAGPARLVVTASRQVLFGLRRRETVATRDLELRFDPPRLSVVSTHHFVKHGGPEMVVYRVTPPNVESGVRVGDLSYPGYPASGINASLTDPSLKVAFFALLHDQDLTAPIALFATDEASNQATAQLDYRVFPRTFRKSRIELDDRFLQRVVPPILEQSPEIEIEAPDAAGTTLLPAFLRLNGDLRRINADKIASFASKTSSEALWRGPFEQMSNSQVESAFADYRTYLYKGEEVDRQVHLGYDLARTAAVEVKASNRGRVLYADYLGIYGNCVILDHGMGLQSLYAHLSSFTVKEGDAVEKDQTIGRTGSTGMAGGDHLHFTVLLQGRPIHPVELWDPHWIEDRVTRKIREAGGGVPAAGEAPASPRSPGAGTS